MGLFGSLFKPSKYSARWMRSLSNDEWERERESVRLLHCSGDENAMYILDRFDREYYRRNDDGRPWTPPAHSEHGWYLSEDDD